MDYLQITGDIVFGFLALFLITKLLGKTQITQITPFDFISALILGELVGNAVFDKKVGLLQIGYALALWGVLIYIMEVLTQKVKATRGFLDGRPALIIYKGKLDRDKMRKNKLDINMLQHLLRSKDVFSIREVQYAVLETDGSISVLKKSDYQNVSKSDMNLPKQLVPLPRTIISDGEVIWDNLKEADLDEQWLEQQLLAQNISKPEDVIYAEYKEDDPTLYVIPF